MKKVYVVLLTVSLLLAGCDIHNEGESTLRNNEYSEKEEQQTEEITLNERQKSILEKEGLPQEYSELNYTYKDSIVKIEQCFQYLDTKYPDVEFEYVTFYTSSPKHLVVYSKDDSRERPVSVYVQYSDGSFSYQDTYMQVYESDIYAEEVKKYISGIYPETDIIVDSSISESDYVPGDEYVMTRASATTSVIMPNVFSDEEETRELLQNVMEWLGTYTDKQELVYLIVLNKEDFGNVTIENCDEDYIRTKKYIYKKSISKDVDGNIRLFD